MEGEPEFLARQPERALGPRVAEPAWLREQRAQQGPEQEQRPVRARQELEQQPVSMQVPEQELQERRWEPASPGWRNAACRHLAAKRAARAEAVPWNSGRERSPGAAVPP